MTERNLKVEKAAVGNLVTILFGLPWLEIVAELWKIVRKIWHGLAEEGIYEVLEHEGTLEIKDKSGKRALVRKRQRVRYLQDNVIAYNDQAWGDGEILVNYRCTPGKKVDRYRAGHKDVVLVSLREIKKRGDVDEFNIEWEHRNGFLKAVEEWGTEVNHRTKQLKIQIIFPKARKPHNIALVEYLRRRTRPLNQEAIRKLPDGCWLVSWQTNRPRLYEQYSFKWEW